MSHNKNHPSNSADQGKNQNNSGSGAPNQDQPHRQSGANGGPDRSHQNDPSRQHQPGQQQQYQSRPGQKAPGSPNQVGQNQAGQAESRADTDAADTRKVAARQENDRFKAANRREDGADRQPSSLDNAGGGIADAARRQGVEDERSLKTPGTASGDRLSRADEGSDQDQGKEVGQDATRAAQTPDRSANASRVADPSNRNQTDKDRQAMKNR